MTRFLFSLTLLVVLAVAPVAAQKRKAAPPDNYDVLFAKFLDEARRQAASPDPASWMNDLMMDPRARRVNDLLTVRVEESITASGTADASVAKNSKASAATPSLFGAEKKLPGLIDPTNLTSAASDTQFKGSGSTTRAGVLTTTMTARVAEVLPSGDLVLEAVREIEINGDRQIVVLTGVARRADIAAGNVISSTSLGELRIRYFGRGLMKDSLTPGWLLRVLNRIF